ncbi:MAG: hypothetical protein LBV04_10380, partial [Deferribacteraceae bacterium]|nr:hypothetical protein [Deferribacteraceae bacterium]
MRIFISFCVALCLFCSLATAQTLELNGNLQMQDQGIVYVAPQEQSRFDPFDRDVHLGLHYGKASRDIYVDDDNMQDFNVIGLSAYGYGRHWGMGIAFSYLMEEETSESNIFVANDKL